MRVIYQIMYDAEHAQWMVLMSDGSHVTCVYSHRSERLARRERERLQKAEDEAAAKRRRQA